ncbi:hypothetical protein M9Y10_002258 [Tritrichomonas musculus]|uniref:Uncharacterized protein n=1 Tax=Tritrichomonas musculus TaxID=1915356 RepID=A0ABR2L9A3_9EUKA
MALFSESSYDDDDYYSDSSIPQTKVSNAKKNNGLRDVISSILFTCSGETTQYEETISALEDSLIYYLHHLTQESLKCAKNPHKISSEDIILALKEYPQIQNNIMTFLDDMDSIKKDLKH